MSRRRAGRALLRDRDEAARSRATRSSWSSATGPTTPSAGAWCCPTRRSPTSRPPIPRAPRRSAALRLLGRHRRASTAARVTRSTGHGFCGIGRKRLLNILQDRARGARRRAALRDRDRRPRALSRLRPDRRRRRRQLQGARRARATSSSPTSTCAPASTSGSARTRNSTTPSPSSSRRPSTAGSGRTPTSSMPTPRPSSSNAREATWRRARLRRA